MTRKKRLLSRTMMALLLSLTLSACGGQQATESSDTVQQSSETQQSSEEAEQSESSSASSEQSDAGSQESDTNQSAEATDPAEFVYNVKEFEIPDNEGIRMVQNMKIGWNLGNSFDAIDCNLADEMKYESAWCGANATPELFAELKKAGFNTVRIPVSWHNHLSDKSAYTISQPWLDRVKEVVGYALDQDMYVIVNIHHDNSKQFIYPSNEYRDQSVEYVKRIWTQLAEAFRDYDEKVLFAGLNEPRLVGHNNEWWIDANNQDCKDAIAIINELNQLFVDTVRASGGNNASRYLICPGYDASPDGATNKGFVFPTDPVDNDHHIILSIHAYTPYNFALESPGVDDWSSKNARDLSNMVGFMNKIYSTYIQNGTPVIIDEFGAMEKNGNLSARTDFAGCFIANAKARGMSCIWWDNNVTKGSGERFGIINRKTLEWQFPEIVENMMKQFE